MTFPLERSVKVLGVDPSSTCTGFALMQEAHVIDRPSSFGRLLEWGLIKPSGLRGRPTTERVRGMAEELRRVARDLEPDVAVIEVPSGKVARNKKHAGGAGLSVYGFAAGQMDCVLWRVLGVDRVVQVDEIRWTGGAKKAGRANRVQLLFPQYDHTKDRGLDAADAIGLAHWLLIGRERERRATA